MRAEVQLTQPEVSEHAGYGIIRQCWTRRLVVRVHWGEARRRGAVAPALVLATAGTRRIGGAPYRRIAGFAVTVATLIFV